MSVIIFTFRIYFIQPKIRVLFSVESISFIILIHAFWLNPSHMHSTNLIWNYLLLSLFIQLQLLPVALYESHSTLEINKINDRHDVFSYRYIYFYTFFFNRWCISSTCQFKQHKMMLIQANTDWLFLSIFNIFVY